MIALTLITIIFQVRSISAMTMVFVIGTAGTIGVMTTSSAVPAAVRDQRRRSG